MNAINKERGSVHGVASGARVLERSGARVVIDEVPDALFGVANLPALRQWLLVFARLETRVLPLRQALVVVHVVDAAAALWVSPPALLPAERQRAQLGHVFFHPVGRRGDGRRARVRHLPGRLHQRVRARFAGARNEQEAVRVRTLRRRARIRVPPTLVLVDVVHHLRVWRRPRGRACVVVHVVYPVVAGIHPPLPAGR